MSTRVTDPASSAPADGAQAAARVTASEAARRYWPLVLGLALLGVGLGLTVAILRSPTYEAESRLAVGRIDISAPGAIGSFAIAAEKLASQYSRAIDAESVTRRVANRAGISQAAALSRISATPVPESPVIRVTATGLDAAGARRLADIAANALIAYTTSLNRSNPDSPRLLDRFRAEALRSEELSTDLRRAERRYGDERSGENLNAVQDLRVDLRVSQLQAETLRTAYDSSTRSQAATTLLSMLQRATPATSDRGQFMQFLGFIGLAAGLALGFALATLRANRGTPGRRARDRRARP